MSKTVKLAVVWLALLLLLGLSVWVWSLHLSVGGTPLALGIALLKAGLVAAFFMHLEEESRLVRFLVAGVGFWLFVMFSLTLADFFTRG